MLCSLLQAGAPQHSSSVCMMMYFLRFRDGNVYMQGLKDTGKQEQGLEDRDQNLL